MWEVKCPFCFQGGLNVTIHSDHSLTCLICNNTSPGLNSFFHEIEPVIYSNEEEW